MDEAIVLSADDYSIDDAGYAHTPLSHFESLPDIAKPLVASAQRTLHKMENSLYSMPAFLNAVKAAIPDVAFQAILSDEQKSKLAAGAIKLMTKKDGSLMANLVNPSTKKIVGTVSL